MILPILATSEEMAERRRLEMVALYNGLTAWHDFAKKNNVNSGIFVLPKSRFRHQLPNAKCDSLIILRDPIHFPVQYLANGVDVYFAIDDLGQEYVYHQYGADNNLMNTAIECIQRDSLETFGLGAALNFSRRLDEPDGYLTGALLTEHLEKCVTQPILAAVKPTGVQVPLVPAD